MEHNYHSQPISADCKNVSGYLGFSFCQGSASVPGIRREVLIVNKNDIVQMITEKTYNVSATNTIDPQNAGVGTIDTAGPVYSLEVLESDCELTSESQGEYLSQTYLNKLELFVPYDSYLAQRVANNLLNTDLVFLVDRGDGDGLYRRVGSPIGPTKVEVKYTSGKGLTGKPGYTINVEAPDTLSAPICKFTSVPKTKPEDPDRKGAA